MSALNNSAHVIPWPGLPAHGIAATGGFSLGEDEMKAFKLIFSRTATSSTVHPNFKNKIAPPFHFESQTNQKMTSFWLPVTSNERLPASQPASHSFIHYFVLEPQKRSSRVRS